MGVGGWVGGGGGWVGGWELGVGWGGGSWGLGVNRTPIDISSFYLPSEFFFSSELRRDLEKTLHHGVSPLADENV